MHPEAKEELRRRLKLTVLEYAKYVGVTEACREFNVPRSTFYRWKQTYEQEGRAGLYHKKPIAHHHLYESFGLNTKIIYQHRGRK